MKPRTKPLGPALRRVLEIEVDANATTGTRDAYGQTTPDWQAVATVRAEIKGLSGQERWSAQQTLSTQVVEITIRHRAGLTTAHRFYEPATGKTFEITAIPPQQIPQWLTCLCTESSPTTANR